MVACPLFAFVLRGLLLPAVVTSGSTPRRSAGDAPPIATTITEVTVHRGSALVTRRGVIPDGGGRFAIEDLPGALVQGSVRLKLDGGEANGVEVHEARRTTIPEERLAALERRRFELTHVEESAADQLALETTLRTRLEGLLDQEATAHAREVASGRANGTAWTANFAWLDEQLLAARKSERAAQWALENARADVAAASAELGQLAKSGAVQTFTVAFDVVALRQGSLDLEVDYLVQGASWTPRYDLRADRDLKQVDLVYRAEVRQQSGEDWKGVDLYLSTAEPQRGVVGPKAQTVWLALAPPRRAGRTGDGLALLGYAAGDKESEAKRDLGVAAPTLAAVENEGLSVRYRLARKETIESRPAAATVLVGRAALAVTGERVCTPALDPTVWLRGRTRNTSDYVLLPGPSAVFFGNDFVGQSTVALVRPGQEFTLHLGLDAGLKVERIHVADESGTAGFFTSKKQKSDRWRILLENHGALAAGADGGVTIEVREILPLVNDDRIEVELTGCTPKLATGGRFDRDREERGVLTWELNVANGAKAEIDWQSRIRWPADEELAAVQGAVVPLEHWPGGGAAIGALVIGGALALRRRWRRRVAQLPLVVGAFCFAASARTASAQQPVESRIERVTVWGEGALVERVATLPGAGSFLIRGLPAAADPATIRVRIAGGEVVGVDLRERRERALPDERLDALRATIQKLANEKQQLEDERAALQTLAAHLAKLAIPSPSPAAASAATPDDARPDVHVWAAEREFLATRFAELQKALRTNEWALAAKGQELETARQSLKGGETTSVVLRDVAVDAVAANGAGANSGGTLQCELSYLVDAAGWAPAYELRARKDLASVQLDYRARVWQTTAEDWREVDLWLSTAQPRRGAAGPDPESRRLTLRSRTPAAGLASAPLEQRVAADEVELDDSAKAAVAAPKPGATRAPPFAAVSDEGLSVRFHLPDRQSIAPRGEGTVVLIGRTELPLRPERSCVPALDPTVWLAAKATNSSEWTLLPGETAVHFGNDYLGAGTLALTRKGEEFDVALGPDPFVTVERVALEDQLQSSAFSSKGTQSLAWRLKFENHGAPSTARDGAITVRMEEALPRARDERITVRLDSARPEPSTTKEDQKLRDERSLLTWRLTLPRAGKSEIEWRWSARFPEKGRLFASSDATSEQ